MKTIERLNDPSESLADLYAAYAERVGLGYPERAAKLLWEYDTFFSSEVPIERPAATITIPVLLPGESHENVLHTLRQTERAALQTGQLEVILWGDKRFPERRPGQSEEAWYKEVEAMDSACQRAINKLVSAAKKERFDPRLINIRPAMSYYNPHDTMTEIRSDYMEGVCYDLASRDFPPTHPIIWLDADTTFIAKNALQDIILTLEKDDSVFFVNSNLVFTGTPGDPTPYSKRNYIDKGAALYALARQIVERDTVGYSRYTYVNEHGIGMRAGDYLSINGLHRYCEPTSFENFGETKVLADNAVALKGMAHIFTRIPTARIGSSYRKVQQIIETCGLKQSVPQAMSAPQYQTFIQTHEIRTRNQIPDLGAIFDEAAAEKLVDDVVNLHVGEQALFHKEQGNGFSASFPEEKRRLLARLVQRLDFPKND